MRHVQACSVAVVGGAGFLGSHLVEYLLRDRHCEVLVIDNLVVGRREWVPAAAKFYHHDITASEEHLRNVFARHKVRYVFNYAAYPYVPDSYSRPLHVFNVNAVGAMRVINAAAECGCCEAILQVSSAELYGGGMQEIIPARLSETCYVEPHSSYGLSKAAVDSYVQVRFKEAGLPCIALRQFNCVGERETHPYVVPEIISQLDRQRAMTSGPVVKLGNNTTRDFMYAGDAVRIAVLALEYGQFGEVYNLGSEHAVKIHSLPALLGPMMNVRPVLVIEDPSRYRPWDIWHLQSDNSKLRQVIGCSWSEATLTTALHNTVMWYIDNGRKWVWEQ